MTTAINQDQTTTLIAGMAGEDYIVNARIETSALAIDASGAVSGRQFTINGTVSAADGTAMVLGDAALAAIGGFVKIGDGGMFKSGGKGLVAESGGVSFTNVGTVETASTAVVFNGNGNVLENDATMTSTAGSAIVTIGAGDNLNNTGTGSISAARDAIVSTGNRTTITNSGTIASSAGSAISASGKSDRIDNTGTIDAHGDAVVSGGASASVTNSDGTITSTAGRGIVSTASGATITNHAVITAFLDGIASSGAGATITNTKTVTSQEGAAIRSTGDDVVITNSTVLSGKTFGIISTGNSATITNFADISATGTAIAIGGDDAIVTTSAHLNGATALLVSGNGALVTIENAVAGTSKTAATIAITATGHTAITNHGSVDAASSHLAIEAGKGAESILNTGSLLGDVRLGAGNDWFSALEGQVTGTVYGGKGNDTYVVGIDLAIRETAGGGIDTVQSKFTYTLGANIENLELLGKKTMDATGNALANRIQGNEGNNHLTGLGGRDVFVFETGSRQDIVTDFTDRKDHIDLAGYDGIAGFADLSGHIKQSGADVVIRLDGHDRLTIENVHKTDLSADDFIF